MASEYRVYLAANILNEDRVITYRQLSRALKVHVNTAKEMLFEFHRQQNGKKPGTVHATYLLAGNKRRQEATATNGAAVKDGEDDYMQSSPFRSSPILNAEEALEDSPELCITLVREENLDELRSQYEAITSIHVYSLGPFPLKDLQVLSDATREITEAYAHQDALEGGGIYGTIINKGVKRRAGRRPPSATAPLAAPVPAKSSTLKEKHADVKENPKQSSSLNALSAVKPAAKSSQAIKGLSGNGPLEKKSVSGNAHQLERESSNIFKSFAKARPKLKREGTDSSAGASGVESAAPSGPEDEPMKDASEDEGDGSVPPLQVPSKVVDTDRKSRKEREEALKKMMDDDINDDLDDEPAAVREVEDEVPSTKEVSSSHPAEQAAHISGGRRRGKKRVMKKKTIKDEEGYLVTREEPAWESFSEDEPLVTKSKAASSSFSSGTDKSKKGSSKPGQGNIMSFFGKK